MQIAQALSGYSLGEADLLRRAMGKKIKAEMDAQRGRFVSGAMQRGIAESKADEIFDLLAKFADYGFNKSHAAAYALIAYQTAWFKANYPVARHSHSVDALYYIVSGSLKLGTEWLGAGDGFWLSGDTPYTYTAGPEGLEVLEFRHTSEFTTAAPGGTKAYFDKAVAAIEANRAAWLTATPPRAAA